MYIDENIDGITTLIHSILQFEVKELIKHISINKEATVKILQNKAPLLYELQKDIIIHLVRFVLKPSSCLYEFNNQESSIIDDEIMIKQSNFNFIFKILNIFIKLATDKSMKQDEIDSFLPR
ncbi:unnamed protein product, partial [Rotaria sp. Silwood1]